MKTYIYKPIDSSTKRGYNRTIEVFRVKNNVPIYLGYDNKIDTASYKGDKAVAKELIAELEGYTFEGYDFKAKSTRENVQVFEV